MTIVIPFEWNHLKYIDVVEDIGFDKEQLPTKAHMPGAAWTVVQDGKIMASFGGLGFGTRLVCWALVDEEITTSALLYLIRKGRFFFDEAFNYGFTRVEAAARESSPSAGKLLEKLGLEYEFTIRNYQGQHSYDMYARVG